MKRALRIGALLLGAACLAWVLRPLLVHGQELADTVEGSRLLGWTAAGAVAYAVFGIVLAVAWWWLAGVYGGRPPMRRGYDVYARSQLAKYLPGNAFHYVGRQVLGRQAGLSHASLVASGILELASLLAAAGVLALLAAGHIEMADHGHLAWISAGLGVFVVLFGWQIFDEALRRFGPTRRWLADLPRLKLRDSLRLLGPSLVCHGAFFAGTGLILWALVAVLAPEAAFDSFWPILGVYPLAWMAGTVTVGAPAGVGVREAVLTWQLGLVLTPAQAAAAALALRVVTLAGDLLTALAGSWLAPREDRQTSEP